MKKILILSAMVALALVSFGFQRRAKTTTVQMTLAWNDRANDEGGFAVYVRESMDEDFRLLEVIERPNVETYTYAVRVSGGEQFDYYVTALREDPDGIAESEPSNISTTVIDRDILRQ